MEPAVVQDAVAVKEELNATIIKEHKSEASDSDSEENRIKTETNTSSVLSDVMVVDNKQDNTTLMKSEYCNDQLEDDLILKFEDGPSEILRTTQVQGELNVNIKEKQRRSESSNSDREENARNTSFLSDVTRVKDEEIKMESSEIICAEVQENENVEIIYVEKIENGDHVVMNNDFCVVESEIATTAENVNLTDDSSNPQPCYPSEPVEIIFLQHLEEDGDGNAVILNQEVEVHDEPMDENSESNVTANNAIKTYVKKHQNFIKLETVSDDNYKQIQPQIKHHQITKSAQTQKLNALLQVASGKVNQMSNPQGSRQDVKSAKQQFSSKPNVHARRLSIFSQQRPKLWSHRVDRRNFGLLSNITNITSRHEGLTKPLPIKEEHSDVTRYEVNAVEVQTAVKRKGRELPYQCEMCNKSFRQASSLVIHQKVHATNYADNCVIS